MTPPLQLFQCPPKGEIFQLLKIQRFKLIYRRRKFLRALEKHAAAQKQRNKPTITADNR